MSFEDVQSDFLRPALKELIANSSKDHQKSLRGKAFECALLRYAWTQQMSWTSKLPPCLQNPKVLAFSEKESARTLTLAVRKSHQVASPRSHQDCHAHCTVRTPSWTMRMASCRSWCIISKLASKQTTRPGNMCTRQHSSACHCNASVSRPCLVDV